MSYPKIAWQSAEERLQCFDALMTLARRGAILITHFKISMEVIMERPITELDLIPEGIEIMRRELLANVSKENKNRKAVRDEA